MTLPALAPADAPYVCRIEPVVDGIHETQLMLMVCGQCVGRVGMRHLGVKAACIRQLFVNPEHRGSGFGKQLVTECVRLATDSGCDTLELGVSAANQAVIPFYEKLGFVEAGHLWSSDIIMSLPLKPITPEEKS